MTWSSKNLNFQQEIVEAYQLYKWFKDVVVDMSRVTRMNCKLKTNEVQVIMIFIQEQIVY